MIVTIFVNVMVIRQLTIDNGYYYCNINRSNMSVVIIININESTSDKLLHD